MNRWLFNILLALSLALCLTLAALWIRSYWREDLVEHWTVDRGGHRALSHQMLRSARGRLHLEVIGYAGSPFPLDGKPWRWQSGQSQIDFGRESACGR